MLLQNNVVTRALVLLSALQASICFLQPATFHGRNKHPLLSLSLKTYTVIYSSTNNENGSTARSYPLPRHRRERNRPKFIRIQPRNSRGNRRVFELQTAVTTLSKTMLNGEKTVIDLHSMIHFGEESYFSFYNDHRAFGSKYQKAFYELIVSEDILKVKPDGSRCLVLGRDSTGKSYYPIGPPLTDVNTARAYDLECQLNIVDYTQPNWIHCDATREEYDAFILGHGQVLNDNDSRSLVWSLASTTAAPIQEYISALTRPLTPSTVSSNTYFSSKSLSSQRLFSNLFLQGDSLAAIFRLLIWSFSPSPEVSILLLDWSSLVDPKPTGMVSPIFIPVLESLFTGNLVEARRLVFAQMLVSGQTTGGRDENLIRKRNSVAIDKLVQNLDNTNETALDEKDTDPTETTTRYALLYGAMHCQDLQSRLQRMGYGVTNVEWRTAWSVTVPTFGSLWSTSTGERQVGNIAWGNFAIDSDPKDIGIGLVVVPIYLLIGGLDWIGTIEGIAQSLENRNFTDAIFIVGFYLLRHLAMYIGLSKFVVEWDGEVKLF